MSKSRSSEQTGFNQVWNMHTCKNKMWMIDQLYIDVLVPHKVKSLKKELHEALESGVMVWTRKFTQNKPWELHSSLKLV